MQATVDGLSLSGFEGQHDEYLRDLRAGRKEPLAATLFQASVRPGSVVVDGGAYVGYYTLLAARLVGATGRVHSFEPHPRTFRALQHNVRNNGLSGDRVLARPECLTDRVGPTTFHLAAGDASESSMFSPRLPAGRRAVGCTSLDAALDGDWCADVIKLDVEGGEVQALQGMRCTLDHNPAITLIVEYNPRALRRAGRHPSEVLTELHDAGLRVQAIDERGRRLAPLEEIDGLADGLGPGHVNLYCQGRGAPELPVAPGAKARARLSGPALLGGSG